MADPARPSAMPISVDRWIEVLAPYSAALDPEVMRDFIARMDPDYFAAVPPQEIARQIGMAGRLAPDEPCQVSIRPEADDQYEIVVVAYDYFSEFAVICGLLSAYGLDIREGIIYTSGDAPAVTRAGPGPFRTRRARPGLSRRKIVDLFRVRAMPGTVFTATRQQALAHELTAMIRLLDAQRFDDARRQVNRRLVETLSRRRAESVTLLHPVQIRFDNAASPTDTVMDIRSTDTPAFLYAFANALSLRGLYIRKALLGASGPEIHDRFFVRGRRGQKIATAAEQEELKTTAVLIKQFTHFLAWAPDPAKAIAHFDQFLDQVLQSGQKGTLGILRNKKTLALLAQVLGTSDFLWEEFLRRQHDNLAPLLADYGDMDLVRPRRVMVRELRRRLAGIRDQDRRRRVLNQYKDEQLFRIDMKHLADPATTLPDFSRALTELAEATLEQAVADCQAMLAARHGRPRLPGGARHPFAVFGMGKFGGRELGYASDIELLFVYEGAGQTDGTHRLDTLEYFERLIQELLAWIEAKQEGIFHLDVRLRPHGGKGLLANTLAELQAYYSPTGAAAPFERQALIKLRWVTGDAGLGKQVEAHRDTFVYSGLPWDLPTALELRQRQIAELVEPGRTNVKFSAGGLIDVEYAVQYLQVSHGHRHARLRTPNTMEALRALRALKIVTAEDERQLREAYLFFRTLIDGMRIVRGNAKDLVLPAPGSDEYVFLARRVGYAAADWKQGAAQLEADLARHMGRTREFFAARFGPVGA